MTNALNLPVPPATAPVAEDPPTTAFAEAIAAGVAEAQKLPDLTQAEDIALGETAARRAGPYVSNDPKAVAPELSIVNGVPHLTLALTKATKAHIAGVATLITGAAGFAIGIEPDSYGTLKIITGAAVVLGAAVLSWLGVKQATNLPKKV